LRNGEAAVENRPLVRDVANDGMWALGFDNVAVTLVLAHRNPGFEIGRRRRDDDDLSAEHNMQELKVWPPVVPLELLVE
jgi:hypothetical protein